VTPLHHDASSILFCQVFGRKQFRLASPLEVSLFDGALSMYSSFDPERPEGDPRSSSVTFKDFTLAPGEALYIPAGWWHHVRALDVSISFAVNHFDRPNNFDPWYRPGEIA
jgi:ribosomal protein L16 Arg81 hydroxylase